MGAAGVDARFGGVETRVAHPPDKIEIVVISASEERYIDNILSPIQKQLKNYTKPVENFLCPTM